MSTRIKFTSIIGEARLRATWDGMFSEGSLGMRSRLAGLRRVEGEFEKYVGIVNGTMAASRVELTDLHDNLMGLARDTPFSNLKDFPLNLGELERGAIIIPVMVSGLPFAAATVGMLREIGKDPVVVFARYSKNKARQMNLKPLGEGSVLEVDVPRSHAEFLASNSARTAVIVDGWITTGQTFSVMEQSLVSFGFEDIRMVHYSDWIRLSRRLDGSSYASEGMLKGKSIGIVVNTMDERHIPLSELARSLSGERL